jgi:hypothetical protein
MRGLNDSINMDHKVVSFGYDLQPSTLTQRLKASHCGLGDVCWVVQITRNFFPFFTINHAVTLLVEALHHKQEGCGLISRWRYWNFPLA